MKNDVLFEIEIWMGVVEFFFFFICEFIVLEMISFCYVGSKNKMVFLNL